MGSDRRNHFIYLQITSKIGRQKGLNQVFLPSKKIELFARQTIASGLVIEASLRAICVFGAKNVGFKPISGQETGLNI
jgi:hypothetical protein